MAIRPIAADAMQQIAVVPFPAPELEEEPVIRTAVGGFPVPAARPVTAAWSQGPYASMGSKARTSSGVVNGLETSLL